MADRTVTIRLVAAVGQFQTQMAAAAASTQALQASTKGLGTAGPAAMQNLGRSAAASSAGIGKASTSMGQLGSATAAAQAPLTGMTKSTQGLKGALGGISPTLLGAGGLLYGAKAVTGAAIEWESAFAGVKKTVNGTDAELSGISDGLRDMSKQIPTSSSDLAAIAESAGQLGIETPNVLGFTKVIADLGETTNLSGQEGATQLARFANITGMAQGDFDRLGSTLVELGNNFATTEAEIVDMSLRLAGAGTQVGLTEGEILGMATALSSVGIEAEAGGSAISKVMIDIASEVETGGDKLATFAEVAGMAPQEFADAWRNDAAGALSTFVTGLGELDSKGGSALGTLEELGITEVRMRDALLRAAGAGDLFSDALDTQNVAWQDNNALQEEAAQRYETTEAKMQIAKNAVGDLATEIGEALLPQIVRASDGLTDLLAKDFTLPTTDKQVGVGDVAQGASSVIFGDSEGLARQIADIAGVREEMEAYEAQVAATEAAVARAELAPDPDWTRIEEGTSVLDTIATTTDTASEAADNFDTPDPDWSRIEEGTAVLEGTTVAWEDTELAASNTGEAFRFAEERLQDYLDTQQAATDPVFALNKAFQDTIDTHTAYTESVQAIDDAERSLEGAHRDVEAAQRDKTEAVKEHGEGSQEALDAAWALEEAERAVGTAEREVAAAHEATTGAAFAVAEAQATLEEKVLSGEVSWAEYEAKLQSWVAQGDITKAQAGEMRDRIEELRAKAEETEGRYDVEMEAETEAARDQVNTLRDDAKAAEGQYQMKFYADTSAARERIASLKSMMGEAIAGANAIAPGVVLTASGKKLVLHDGGWVGSDEQAGTAGGLRSDEVPATLQRGEFVVNAAASRRHARILEAINASKMHGGGWAGGGAAGSDGGAGVVSGALGDIASLLDRSGAAASYADDRIASYATTVADSGGPVDDLSGRVQRLSASSDDYTGDYEGTFHAYVVDAMSRIAALRKAYGTIPRSITTTIQVKRESAPKHKPHAGKVQAEDGSWVPKSFYDKPAKPDRTGMVLAEDGSWVPKSFYSHDGGMITEATPGWMPGLKSDERMRVLQTGEMVVSRNSVANTSSTVDNSRSKSVSMKVYGTPDETTMLRSRAIMRAL